MISWKDLCHQFVANFMPTYERPASKNDLKAVHQYKGERFASTSNALAN
jgi:hypothetical protein